MFGTYQDALMIFRSFFFHPLPSAECFQVSTVDRHWSSHPHRTLILPYWLLQFPLVLQEGSSGNQAGATPADVYGDGLSKGMRRVHVLGEIQRDCPEAAFKLKVFNT